DSSQQGHPLILHGTGGSWTATTPAGIGAPFSNLTGIAVTGDTAWVAGTYFDATAGRQHALIARHDSGGWHPVAAPDPGTGDTVLGAITATGDHLWATGYDKGANGRNPLIEFH
ncbi:MAG TPA: hypothetical protein VKB75_08940, partial [Jatrophihabitans sp.]|nr:hypothetical protein [Jatrophihabitans sp.]